MERGMIATFNAKTRLGKMFGRGARGSPRRRAWTSNGFACFEGPEREPGRTRRRDGWAACEDLVAALHQWDVAHVSLKVDRRYPARIPSVERYGIGS